MSYGTKEKKELVELKKITPQNIKKTVANLAKQYSREYAKLVNDRASDTISAVDNAFLSATARKNFTDAFAVYTKDANSKGISNLLREVLNQQTGLNYAALDQVTKEYFGSLEARNIFLSESRAGIRRILQSPLKSGFSRNVIQDYLEGRA